MNDVKRGCDRKGGLLTSPSVDVRSSKNWCVGGVGEWRQGHVRGLDEGWCSVCDRGSGDVGSGVDNRALERDLVCVLVAGCEWRSCDHWGGV